MDIPLSRPDITQAERDAVLAVLNTPNLSLGPRLPEFERLFAEYIDCRHAVAVNSGTSALHLCMRAIGLKPGDEVITTPFSFIASSNCILFEGGKPVFVDIDPETWNIDPDGIEAAITPRTRAILPVDVFGHVANMPKIRQIAEKHDLRVIEDSCEALGATLKGQKAGTFGDVGVFGFYPNKQMTTGEGGMIVTNNDKIRELAVSMRSQGRGTGGGWLSHERLGYNYRLSDINCALGIAQIKRIDEILENRSRSASYYLERLGNEKRVRLQKPLPDAQVSWFVMVVRLSDDYGPKDRDRILEALRKQGIGCSNYFPAIHLQPFYMSQFGYRAGQFPLCEALCDRTVALPFHGLLTEKEADVACQAFSRLL